MARDLSIPVRRAGLAYLQAQASLTALVPKDQIYPPQTDTLPVWPFVQWGASTNTMVQATGYDGGSLLVRVHCYVKGPGDEACGAVVAEVARLLDDADLDLPLAGCYANVRVTQTQIFQDTASDLKSWHGVVTCRIFTSAPSL